MNIKIKLNFLSNNRLKFQARIQKTFIFNINQSIHCKVFC